MWQPIDTAPEKTRLLLYNDVDNEIWVGSFHWIEMVRDEVVSEKRTAHGKRMVVDQRVEREREWEGDGWGASHWMPLPPPPSTDSK